MTEINPVTPSEATAAKISLHKEYAAHEGEIEELYSRVDYWHGTGRKQQRNGEVVDVLDSIIEKGGIQPALDKFDPTVGEQYSTSLAPSRKYAEVYALMNLPEDEELQFQYGTREQWIKKYVHGSLTYAAFDALPSARRILSNMIQRRSFAPRKFIERNRKNLFDWRMKVRLHPAEKGQMRMHTVKSDIPGNYPMLFGLDGQDISKLPTARTIGKHEERTGDTISLGSFTHVEVPRVHVDETREFLDSRGVNLRVLPIEFGELFEATKPQREKVRNQSQKLDKE